MIKIYMEWSHMCDLYIFLIFDILQLQRFAIAFYVFNALHDQIYLIIIRLRDMNRGHISFQLRRSVITVF